MELPTLDYDYTLHQREFAGDDNLLVKFFIRAEPDDKETLTQGRKIFKDVECIDIRTPGSKEVTTRPIRPSDLVRFPKHYAAFKARTTGETLVGTPLEMWPHPQLSMARIAELHAVNIRTVEQIIAAPDSVTSLFMGYQTLKQAAVLFVEASKSSAPLAALSKKLEEATAIIETQGRELARLTALVGDSKRK